LQYRYISAATVEVFKVSHDVKDRKTALATAKDLVGSGRYRYVLLSSLDWLGTGSDVFEFLELADKSRTTVVAVDDGADTHETDWRIIAMCAAMKRGLMNTGSE
jgi:hypothetical protein